MQSNVIACTEDDPAKKCRSMTEHCDCVLCPMRPIIKMLSKAPAGAVDNVFLQWNQHHDLPGKEFYVNSPMGKNAFNEGIKTRMEKCGIEGFTTHGAKRCAHCLRIIKHMAVGVVKQQPRTRV
jgi:hypothetical protein